MDFLAEYGLFLAKTFTLVAALLVIMATAFAFSSKTKGEDGKGKLKIKKLNDKYKKMSTTLKRSLLSKHELKASLKAEKKAEKVKKKRAKKITADEEKAPSRVFLIQFKGDMRATAVNSLREVVTGLLTIATPEDEVVIIIESPGGVVHDYGLAASQLQRLRQHQIPLTAVIDKVAASGGYLMACVANRILCAPFAIVGSIGVIAQLPNFHRLLKQHYIDFEQITGGEFKRTLTMFGRNTNKEREKFQEQVDDIHDQFKTFVSEQRPQMNIEKVATGEYWYGNRALQLNLVDKLTTSDDYLLDASRNKVIYEVSFEEKKTLQDKLSGCIKTCVNTSIATLRQNDREQLHC